jgi:hypothetical protein
MPALAHEKKNDASRRHNGTGKGRCPETAAFSFNVQPNRLAA